MGVFSVDPSKRAQRFRTQIGNVVYSSAIPALLNGGIPKAGYLTAIDLESAQQVVTGATPPVIAPYGAYGPLSKIQFNVGANSPFSLSGYYANIFYQTYDYPYSDARAADPVVASSTNNWINNLRVPLTVGPDTELGAWYAADDELDLEFAITGGAVGQVFSTVNSATIQGSWKIWAERFSAPAPDLDGGWLNEISLYHEVKQIQTVTLQNGTTEVKLPRNRDYLAVMMQFYTGNDTDSTFAPADGLYTGITLLVNNETSIYNNISESELKDEQLRAYTRQLPAGVAIFDFFRQKENSRRDVIPTDAALASDFALEITSTSNLNKVDVIIETVQANPYARRWVIAKNQKAGQKAA